MNFLIEYDRARQTIVTMKRYRHDERDAARRDCLELELRLRREGIEHEVVLLDAESEESLRLTHQRYFPELDRLAERPLIVREGTG